MVVSIFFLHFLHCKDERDDLREQAMEKAFSARGLA